MQDGVADVAVFVRDASAERHSEWIRDEALRDARGFANAAGVLASVKYWKRLTLADGPGCCSPVALETRGSAARRRFPGILDAGGMVEFFNCLMARPLRLLTLKLEMLVCFWLENGVPRDVFFVCAISNDDASAALFVFDGN